VQFVDDRGETAFTAPSRGEDAIDQACDMRLRFFVQAIVDDLSGDIVMNADEIRDEARLRSRRELPLRRMIPRRSC
jgi:hypothetical protein